MTAKKTEFIVTDLISKIFQRKTIMDKLPSQRELAEIYHVSVSRSRRCWEGCNPLV